MRKWSILAIHLINNKRRENEDDEWVESYILPEIFYRIVLILSENNLYKMKLKMYFSMNIHIFETAEYMGKPALVLSKYSHVWFQMEGNHL